MFGEMKKDSFDLERTMLGYFLRLSGITLATALLYVWLLSTRTQIIHNGLHHLVDRYGQLDLSIYQIGLRFIERQLVNAHSVRLSLWGTVDSNCQVTRRTSIEYT
jgi:hypothetical protein